MESTPLVSIITPVYNGADYLDELIVSVRDQDYPSIEHIIIDDGSNDDSKTVAILKKYPHLRWWSRENKGQYATMNEGLVAARGEVVCFISADDLLSPGAVKVVIEHLMKHPNLDGVYGRTLLIDIDRSIHCGQIPCQGLPLKLYPYVSHVSHCSLYIKSKQLTKNDRLQFDPDYRYCGDYDWIIRLVNSGLKIDFLDEILSQIRIHKNQTMVQNQEAMKNEYNTILREYHFDNWQHRFFSALCFLSYVLNKIKFVLNSKGIQGAITLVADWFSRKIMKRR